MDATLLWAVGYFTAGMTAFYMFRLIFMTFLGQSRVRPRTWSTTSTNRRAHAGSAHNSRGAFDRRRLVRAGRKFWAARMRSMSFLEPVVAVRHELRAESRARGSVARARNRFLMLLSVRPRGSRHPCRVLPLHEARSLPTESPKRFGRLLHISCTHKYYVDEIYDALFVNRVKDLGTRSRLLRFARD